MSRANFSDANLRGADFYESLLIGVNFEGTSLEAANLIAAKELMVSQLTGAKTLFRAQLESDLRTAVMIERMELFEDPPPGREIAPGLGPGHFRSLGLTFIQEKRPCHTRK